jgi:uncharacterized protein (TIGR02271 family)
MDAGENVPVRAAEGWSGYADAADLAAGRPVQIRLDNGERLTVPAEALAPQPDGSYRLLLGPEALSGGPEAGREVVVPVVEETLDVARRVVETGRVRVTTSVGEREAVVDEPLLYDEIEVTRVPVNRYLSEPASVRTEGDTTVIPVLEEVLVVEKRLLLKEEIRLTRHRRARHEPQRVLLKSEEVQIERTAAADRTHE